MKTITLASATILTILSLSSCSSKVETPPSQNAALKEVSPNGKDKSGAMQNSLDSWLITDWTPTIEKDEEINTKYKKTEQNSTEIKERNFTLQEYVDKAGVYLKSSPKSHETSHVKAVESLPVIGK